ncbi:type I pullulanase [Paenibacillus sp. JX-17]|uniref:pullulanase n=1 Tax=Paenibacillus lacisoli TaxID=3064525 RepID=A0ABT9CJP1_9BACL|nr:type I pullulanase [Paenibacillus sp. JX-17]MDO7908157.1 type I pullulanase [Paenibacillus sp. JX-17]
MNRNWDLEDYSNLYSDDHDFGLTYSREGSAFKIWAPTASSVSVCLYLGGGNGQELQDPGTDHQQDCEQELAMQRREDGVWTLFAQGDWKGYYYLFLIRHGDAVRYAVDPYAKAVSANGVRAAIVDLKDSDPEGWNRDTKPAFVRSTDAIIYELHVRDFSSDPEAGYVCKGKFAAFTERGLKDHQGNAIGIDHLQELGITHIHLLPVYDFKTVDELDHLNSGNSAGYNWGYDPQNYNVPEGSYASDPSDPLSRIREFKMLVQALHSAGIRVVLDVVYNHTYEVEKGPFEAVVPGYYYRTDSGGRLSNGSGVGNELATERPMVRKFIKDSVRYWAEEYHVDGFRFDLMGLIDNRTMRELADELRREVDSGMLIYGEPWTGGESPLWDKTLKGTQQNGGFAVFNDHYRSAIKGDSDGGHGGFATGMWGTEGGVVTGLTGALHDFAASPEETVNYVTAHDNLNLWDKIAAVHGLSGELGFPHWDNGRPLGHDSADDAIRQADPYRYVNAANPLAIDMVRRSILANGMVLTSQGIAFLHAGDELLRSKFGDHNSYRSGDAVNAIRWSNKARFRPVFDYYRGLIELRRRHTAFRLDSRELVEQHMRITRCGDQIIMYTLTGAAGHDDWNDIIVIYNGSEHDQQVQLPDTSPVWHVVVDEYRAGTEVLSVIQEGMVNVPRLSMMVLYDRETAEQRNTLPARIVEIQYDRADRQYDGWNVWVWGTGLRDGSVSLVPGEDGRAHATVKVAPDVRQIGYIIRLNHWEAKDGETDRFIELHPDETAVRVMIRSGEGDMVIVHGSGKEKGHRTSA